MIKSFKDYKSNRKITEADSMVTEKPKTKLVADYEGPDAKTPDQGKNSAPYKPANGEPASKKAEKGFADLGEKNLVYNPDTKGGDSKNATLGKDIKSNWPKLKSEGWFEKTRKMNRGEFVKYMNEECGCGSVKNEGLPTVNAYNTGPIHPYPPEAIKYVTALGNQNPKLMNDLVHEMKRSGGLDSLLEAILEHQEAYAALSSLMGESQDGPKRCRAFARSMNENCLNNLYEAVGPPLMGMDDDEDDPRALNPKHPHDDLGDDEDDEDLESFDDDDTESEEGEDEEMGDEDQFDDEDDMGDEESEEDEFSDEDDMGDDSEDAPNFDDEDDMGGEEGDDGGLSSILKHRKRFEAFKTSQPWSTFKRK